MTSSSPHYLSAIIAAQPPAMLGHDTATLAVAKHLPVRLATRYGGGMKPIIALLLAAVFTCTAFLHADDKKPSAVSTITLPKGKETARDAAGRVVHTTTASSNGSVTTRDASGRVKVQSIASSSGTTTHRDSSGRVLATTSTSASGKATTRDASGRTVATATSNAKGDVLTYRDASGRMLGTKTTSSSGAVTYRDASGRTSGPEFK